jgi:hypothetical protein
VPAMRADRILPDTTLQLYARLRHQPHRMQTVGHYLPLVRRQILAPPHTTSENPSASSSHLSG